MEKDNKNTPKKKDKASLTLFFIFLPSLLIAMTGAITSVVIRIAFQIVILFYQYVAIRNLLEDYYGY